MVTLGQETINTPLYVQLDQAKAYVLTDCLQTIALVGEPCTGESRDAGMVGCTSTHVFLLIVVGDAVRKITKMSPRCGQTAWDIGCSVTLLFFC